MPLHLTDRFPQADPDRLLDQFVPPPRFAQVRFETYRPDPAEPTQAAALQALGVFAEHINSPAPKKRLFRRAAPPELRAGVYLDGGFGVGKTHLLASLAHVVEGRVAFGTFVEYTNLVGALGFAPTVERLAQYRLVCIDEFELDDPGDTVLMSSLLGGLVDAGVRLAATSNTLPDRLGEGRFAAEDFLREIQGLAAHFDVFRIDGPDFRHRDVADPPPPEATEDLQDPHRDGVAVDDFGALVAHLREVHPSRYGQLVEGIGGLHLTDVFALNDQAAALRLVVLVDRLYDRDIPIRASGVPLDQVFTADLLRGGYRKKYYRALSRLVALAREGAGMSAAGVE